MLRGAEWVAGWWLLLAAGGGVCQGSSSSPGAAGSEGPGDAVRGGGSSLPEAPAPLLGVRGGESKLGLSRDGAGGTGMGPGSPRGSEEDGDEAARAREDADCAAGRVRGKACRVRWLPMLAQSFEFAAAQNLGNIALDNETRHDLVTLPYWSTYVLCVEQFRYRQWRDDDNFLVDYVGHGLQGAIASSIFEQNDPKGRGLVYGNNGNYWRSRLKAMGWAAVYEVQWKVGPASEASIGSSGRNTYFTPSVHGRSTNETGFQDFVDTPVVGFWWNVGEDAMDRFVMPKIWSRTRNRWILAGASVLTPSKAAANLLRWRALSYRDFAIAPLR